MIHLAHQPEALRVDEAACKLRWPSVRIPLSSTRKSAQEPGSLQGLLPFARAVGKFHPSGTIG